MNPQQIQAQAQQAATQGQQLLGSDQAQQGQSTNAYNQQSQQAGQANQNLQNYTNYMQGAGSGTNLYNTGLSGAESAIGFDPSVLGTATQNLTRSQNALAGLNAASQSSTGGYGLSGAQLGNYYASSAQPLSNQVGAQSTAVGNLTNLLTASQQQANQYAGAGLQGEQQTAGALGQVFSNYQAQANQSATLMNQFATLAQQQGGLNASEQQAYDAAINSYQQAQLAIAQAKQAMAQTGLIGAQTTGQTLQNQQTQAGINAAAAKAAANPTLTPQQQASAAFLKSSGATPGSIYSYNPAQVQPNMVQNYLAGNGL